MLDIGFVVGVFVIVLGSLLWVELFVSWSKLVRPLFCFFLCLKLGNFDVTVFVLVRQLHVFQFYVGLF